MRKTTLNILQRRDQTQPAKVPRTGEFKAFHRERSSVGKLIADPAPTIPNHYKVQTTLSKIKISDKHPQSKETGLVLKGNFVMFTKGSGNSQDVLQDRLEKEKQMSRTYHPWDGNRTTKSVSLGHLHRTTLGGPVQKRINKHFIYQSYEDDHHTPSIDTPVESTLETTKLLDHTIFRHNVNRI